MSLPTRRHDFSVSNRSMWPRDFRSLAFNCQLRNLKRVVVITSQGRNYKGVSQPITAIDICPPGYAAPQAVLSNAVAQKQVAQCQMIIDRIGSRSAPCRDVTVGADDIHIDAIYHHRRGEFEQDVVVPPPKVVDLVGVVTAVSFTGIGDSQ